MTHRTLTLSLIPWLTAAFWAGACGARVDTGKGGDSGGTPAVGGSATGGNGEGGNAIGGDGTGGRTAETGGASTGGITTRPPDDHRPAADSCEGVHDPPEPTIWDASISQCTQHSDCTEGENGKCVNGVGSAGGMGFCVYDTCRTDADCDPGKVCYCTPSRAASCLSIGNCRTDADCGPQGYCSPSMSFDCGGYRPIDGYHCHTPDDTCSDDSDCTGTDYCNFNPYDNRWECTPVDDTCVIG